MSDRAYYAWLVFGGLLACTTWFVAGYLIGSAR